MVFNGKRGNNHTQQRKTHRTARQGGTTRQHSATGHSTAHQDTATPHTTQQGGTSAPQNAKGNSTAHSNTPQHETPETAQTSTEGRNAGAPAQHGTHRERKQTNTTSRPERTAGHHSTAPHGSTAPLDRAQGGGAPRQTTAYNRAAGQAARQEHQQQSTRPKENSGQPNPARNTQKEKATTHGPSQRKRGNEAPHSRKPDKQSKKKCLSNALGYTLIVLEVL